MRIHFISFDSKNKRGGSLYESDMIDRLQKRFGDEQFKVIYHGKNLEGKPNPIFPHRDALKYASGYNKHAKEMLDCDYLWTNQTFHMYFMSFPWRLKKKNGCKLITITHHLDYLAQPGKMKQLRKKYFTKKLLKHTDCILTPNPYTRDQMKDMGFGDKTRLLEVYLDNTIPETTLPREKFVLTLGAVEPRKGVEYGIEAFAKFSKDHPDYRYIIAGQIKASLLDEDYYEQLKAQIHALGVEDKVTFTGKISDKKKITLYQTAGMFLFPSQLEGYGWVMIEAMRYGNPVIAFDVSAMPYTVNSSNGMLIPNKDTDAMSKAMSSLADDPELYARLAAGARDTVRALPNRETIEQQTEAFLDEIAQGKL